MEIRFIRLGDWSCRTWFKISCAMLQTEKWDNAQYLLEMKVNHMMKMKKHVIIMFDSWWWRWWKRMTMMIMITMTCAYDHDVDGEDVSLNLNLLTPSNSIDVHELFFASSRSSLQQCLQWNAQSLCGFTLFPSNEDKPREVGQMWQKLRKSLEEPVHAMGQTSCCCEKTEDGRHG